MVIHNGYENISLVSPVVTLGIFDGVHRGHRALLEILVERARESGGESVVITFTPHPRVVLEKGKTKLFFLTTMEEKISLLRKCGVDHLIIIAFDEDFSKIEACDFLKNILVGKIGAKHLIIGYNHHFGKRGEGDFSTIKDCADPLDFVVEQVQGFHTEEGSISSSSIREALLSSRLDEANRWLGYPYSLSGIVVEGRKLGRVMGFPTANIRTDIFKLVPSYGVYAVEVLLAENRYKGVLSIGTNPTVNSDGRPRSVEVYIFDFENDIYGREITVVFRKRLRDEIRFENTDDLVRQMTNDKLNALETLAGI
jgi:riboflavin kinase / FMN adenylyltransferase